LWEDFLVEVYLCLLCLAGVYVQVVKCAPADKVHDEHPVFQITPLWYTSNNVCVIWEFVEVTVVCVIPEVRCVQNKEKR